MNNINQNVNNYQIIQAQPGVQAQEGTPASALNVQLPDLYYMPNDSFQPKTFKESVKQADPMGFITPFVEHPFLIIPTWLAFGFGIDKFAEACGGEYEKSLLGKAARLGDKLQESKFVKSKPMQSIIGTGSKLGRKWNNIVDKSEVLTAIKTTPSQPEWSIVKSEMQNQKQRIVEEFTKITDTLKLGKEGTIELKYMGLNREEINYLKKTFKVNSISKIPSGQAQNSILLRRLGRSQMEIENILSLGEGASSAVKNEILKEMGLDANKLKLIKKDEWGKYIDEVKTATGKVKGKVKIGAGHYSWMGPLTKPFERTIGCDEVYNRLHSLTVGAKGGAKTKTGRFFSNFLQKIHRGFTFGGGKLGALLFISPLLVEMMINTKKAEPGEKIGTAAHGLVEAVSWVFTFPLALKIMHSFTGMQYSGMTKEQVEKYRELLNNFNKKVRNHEFANKDAYKAERKILKKQLKELWSSHPQNLFTKMLRKLSRFITMDLETIKGYRGNNILTNTLNKVPNFFKNIGGIPMRFVIWGLISMGALGGLINKCTTALFGKYYDQYKEEEYEENKKKQEIYLKKDLQERLLKAQAAKLEALNNPQQTELQTALSQTSGKPAAQKPEQIKEQIPNTMPEAAAATEAAIPKEAEKQQQKIQQPVQAVQNKTNTVTPVKQDYDNYTYIPSQDSAIPKTKSEYDNYTYIPSQDSVFSTKNDNINKYIPAQTPANIKKTFDNSGLASALKRADRAEANAIKILSGKFPGS